MTRVLVVDDKTENLYYLDALLTGHGYLVETAPHGAEALVRARANPPDIVVSDLLMPVMDGYTLLRHWKADPRLSHAPFVVYTATYTQPEDERLARSLGADAFILKPAEPEAFIERIRALDAASRRAGPPEGLPPDDEPDLLKLYSQTLVRKLEEKTLQLEQEVAERRRISAEQQQLADRLEAERARLAEAQAVAHVGSWQTDVASGEVTWSDETHRIFETDPSSFQPTHPAFLEMIHPDDREAVDRAFVTSLETGVDHAVDHRIRMPDGRIKVVQERWRVFHDGQGRPVRAAGTCQDITDRTRAEETLRESEERFRQLAETISEVFWVTDPAKTRMLYVSPAYETIWGRPCEQLYARPETWLEAIHPDDRDLVRETLPGQGEGAYDVTYRVVRPDGAVRWVHDRAFPVRDASGEAYRIVGLAEDVTERKAMESRFLRAQRMESIGTLAGGLAHDLNNVLTPIMMSVELLKTDDSPQARRDAIAVVESSVRKGAEMVRQVLAFARGVEGRRIEVDIAALVHDVVAIANDTFLKAVRVSSHVAADVPMVVGDSTQLHQVLLNLCVNARDAMPDGGAITVAAGRRDVDERHAVAHPDASAGVFVAIEVADTGAGMAPDVLERIFEPFFTTKPIGHGTGLGLSTSLAIVKSHGGFFHVESTPGLGSVFTVFLPAAGERSGDTPAPAAHEAIPRGAGELVLVVDDEERIRQITARMLQRFGYRPLLAANGEEATALFASRRSEVGAVITDMMMPVMDGAATIRALRALDPSVRIIAVSGLADGHDLPGGAEGQAPTRLLAKPYTAGELLRALHDVLREPA